MSALAAVQAAPAARTWEGPSRRQRAYIARLSLELLGIPYPPSETDASQVIARLKAAVEANTVSAVVDDCPL